MHNLSASSQDYLEALLELSAYGEAIRSVDLANKMQVTRASITKAIKVLKAAGYIQQERYSDIYLTPLGIQAAESVRHRHKILKLFLTEILGVDEEISDLDACKMEHSISTQTLEKLCAFVNETLHKE